MVLKILIAKGRDNFKFSDFERINKFLKTLRSLEEFKHEPILNCVHVENKTYKKADEEIQLPPKKEKLYLIIELKNFEKNLPVVISKLPFDWKIEKKNNKYGLPEYVDFLEIWKGSIGAIEFVD